MSLELGGLMQATVPTSLELVDDSKWLADRRGLTNAAREWLYWLPDALGRTAKRADMLATPALHPKGLARAAGLTGRVIAGAGLWATADLANVGYRRVIHGDRRRNSRTAAVLRAERTLRKAGPSSVKLGQFVATSKGLLPEEVVEAFSWCRDEVEPFSPATARRAVESAFGCAVADVFCDFDDHPMAAASIAQVHAARLHDGTEVVVKIQRPGLRADFESELRALALFAAGSEHVFDTARAANLTGFIHLFSHLVLQELDFRIEAANLVEAGLATEHAGMEYVRIPRPIPPYVTERVLVMDRLPGRRYTDAANDLASGVDPTRLLRLGIQGILEHTLVYGVFHGDLHAGNVLLDADGTYGLVDFGIVGRLTDADREALILFMLAFATNDIPGQLEAVRHFGAIPPEADTSVVHAALEEAGVGDITNVTHSDLVDAIGGVVRVLLSHGFRLPPSLVLFFKNLLYLNGLAATLGPDVNLLGEVAPILAYFQTKYAAQLSEIGA